MSNYIVVNNGLLKREKPNTLPIVEFKNYKYDDTIYNKYCKSNEVEVKDTIAAKSRRAGFINTITINDIREVFDLVVPRFEDNPLSQQLVLDTTPSRIEDGWVYTIDLARTENLSDSVSTIEYLTPEEMLRRNMITDIEYLDIISERDEHV